MASNSHCKYCHTYFLTPESYQQHLLKKHALPVWDGIETTSSAIPPESAFRGILPRYDLKVGEKNAFASSHDEKQGGNKCKYWKGSKRVRAKCNSMWKLE